MRKAHYFIYTFVFLFIGTANYLYAQGPKTESDITKAHHTGKKNVAKPGTPVSTKQPNKVKPKHPNPTPVEKKLVSATITFNTTTDNKDRDTKVNVWIYDRNSKEIAILHCCNDEEFTDPGSTTKNLSFTDKILRDDLLHGKLTIHVDTNGNDDWYVAPTLTFSFSSGSEDNIVKTLETRKMSKGDREEDWSY